jgi:hypothetical protein
MKLLFVLVLSLLVVLTAASAAPSFPTASSVFGDPAGLKYLTSPDESTPFGGGSFTADYRLQYFPQNASLSDSTPYNGHNLFVFGSNDDPGAMTGNSAGVQGWTPFLQTHFGSYNVVPEPGTFTLLGFAGFVILFGLSRKK